MWGDPRYHLPQRSHTVMSARLNPDENALIFWAAPVVLLGALLCGEGCKGKGEREKPSAEMATQGHELFGGTGSQPGASEGSGAPGKSGASREAWTILIEGFRGENREVRAQETLAGVRGDGALPEAFIEERGDTTVIAYGRYPGPDDRRAQADLARIRSMRFGEAAPYTEARLMPPQVEGSLPELDLRNAKKAYGPDAIYTLQVGVYSREDRDRPSASELSEFRRLAETAAVQLRNEGELAFYYHGPLRSMVTVGVFGPGDVDGKTGAESEKVGRVRERHPFNLHNGKGIRERQMATTMSGAQTQVTRMQRSALVAIP